MVAGDESDQAERRSRRIGNVRYGGVSTFVQIEGTIQTAKILGCGWAVDSP
jgi:hypothetical protein